MPPLNIRVYDNRKFGRKPLVGLHSINFLRLYKHRPKRRESSIIDLSGGVSLEMPSGKELLKRSLF